MKKLIVIAAVAFAACKGGSSSETPKCDSTCVDSPKVIVDTVKTIDSVTIKK
jgi:hypothetical protein